MRCHYGNDKKQNKGVTEKKMSGKNDRKIRKEVKNVYIKAQGVLYDQIKTMSFGKRLRFAFMIIFKRLK